MQQYLIESPHTKEECLATLDSVLAEGEEVLGKFRWGCAAGEHVSYATIEAESEDAARELLPATLRERARLHPVAVLEKEKILQYHQA